MRTIAFDNDAYLELQSKHISERIQQFDNKLYLEFGGKLFDDFHASRVLPGFEPDSKVKMLLTLKEKVEIIVVINATDIEKNKVRNDLGITYDADVLRLIDAFRDINLFVGSVVIAQYANQPMADLFKKRLENLGITVALHYPIKGYPGNVGLVVSEEGYGKNEYIETSRPLVVVTAPGPGSGKMATCLSQIYHDHNRGIKSGYAKFETFPVWNLPLKHPINLAYEAATADLNDVNMIDPFHFEAYNKLAVNYNRDVEIYPVLDTMLKKIIGNNPYQSPTDMGVNMISSCITNEEAAIAASNDEIIRRYYQALCDERKGKGSEEVVQKIELLMGKADITVAIRKPVAIALNKAEECDTGPVVAIELPDGQIVSGKTTKLLGASAAAILNALKVLGNISDHFLIISPHIIEPIQRLKTQSLGNHNPRLHVDEILIALAISATTNPLSVLAMEQLPKLKYAQAHSTVILADVDYNTFRKLGVNLTSEPSYHTKKLYHK